ncbi:hypothetical protein GFY24_30255 [Nocardia sp. SYP-A9097]|uniref:TRAFAC clade GTPase domain-containing protein n=1 Tax=Nocardia sp. SYP-A9097 TaxID=2663237 RepID=UPI00129BE855|nr:hypothetical protein [Nocardia sp. SYP-A9097]MRH91673.1 hypothetical protein [Nocardia sp. SYP-A9097]
MVLAHITGKAACPYCYHRITLNSIMFRCSGRPAPGKDACPREVDPERVRQLHDATPVLPSFVSPHKLFRSGQRAQCPECAGEAGTRVCPACRSVLPSAFGSGSPMFGMVGTPSAGKTVYLTVLVSELQEPTRRRFGAATFFVGESPMINDVRAWRQGMDEGRLPALTQRASTSAARMPVVIDWQQERRNRIGINRVASTALSFYDTAGEDLETASRATDQRYLAAADGLIVVLDPFQIAGNAKRGEARGVSERYHPDHPVQVLSNVTEMLRSVDGVRRNRKITRPLAVAVTKIDAFYDQIPPDSPIRRPSPAAPHFDDGDSLDIHQHVAGLINEWGGDDVLRHLELNYRTYRLFAVSALGAEPEYRTGRTDIRGVRPHRVSEPLLWLMANHGIVDSGRGQ